MWSINQVYPNKSSGKESANQERKNRDNCIFRFLYYHVIHPIFVDVFPRRGLAKFADILGQHSANFAIGLPYSTSIVFLSVQQYQSSFRCNLSRTSRCPSAYASPTQTSHHPFPREVWKHKKSGLILRYRLHTSLKVYFVTHQVPFRNKLDHRDSFIGKNGNSSY